MLDCKRVSIQSLGGPLATVAAALFLTLAAAGQTLPNAVPAPWPEIQLFDQNGAPLAGGKLYTYAAGTTTPLTTYTDSSAGTPNANPIVLDAAGRGSIWIGANAYKFKLENAAGTLQWTQDNIADTTLNFVTYVKTVGTATLITYVPTQTGGVSRTVASKLNETVSAKDFGCVGNGVADDTVCLQNLVTAAAIVGARAYIPAGTYLNTGVLMPQGVTLACEDQVTTKLLFNGSTTASTYTYAMKSAANATERLFHVKGCSIESKNGTGTSLAAGLTTGINIDGCQRCEIDGNDIYNFQFGVNGVGAGSPGYGVYFATVANNRIHTSWIGISMTNGGAQAFNSNTVRDNRLTENVYNVFCPTTFCIGNLITRNDVEGILPLDANNGFAYVVSGHNNAVIANWTETDAAAGKTLTGITEQGTGFANAFIGNIINLTNSGGGNLNCYLPAQNVPDSDYWFQANSGGGVPCPNFFQFPKIINNNGPITKTTDFVIQAGTNQTADLPILELLDKSAVQKEATRYTTASGDGRYNSIKQIRETLTDAGVAANASAQFDASDQNQRYHLLIGGTTDGGGYIQAYDSTTPTFNRPLRLCGFGGSCLLGGLLTPTGGAAVTQITNGLQVLPGNAATCNAANEWTFVPVAGTPDVLNLCTKDSGGVYRLRPINFPAQITGAGTALIGAANSPAVTNANVYTWLTMTAPDGSTVYIPAWK